MLLSVKVRIKLNNFLSLWLSIRILILVLVFPNYIFLCLSYDLIDFLKAFTNLLLQKL